VCEAADQAGVALRGVQKSDAERGCTDERVECVDKNEAVEEAVAQGEVDLVAGTVWLWSRDAMQSSVDVLAVDEAGQMSLANALAASGAARSLVLFGDPRQLEQPQQGVHPPGTAAAALEHLVGADTLAPDRGLFLDETYRFFFYMADYGEPPHVHVERDRQRAKFWLDPVRAAYSRSFGPPELRGLQRIVEENR
jgi:uncharacterized protein